jgi:hypothetical protein
MESAEEIALQYFPNDIQAGQVASLKELLARGPKHDIINVELGVRGHFSHATTDSGGFWHFALHVPDRVIGEADDSDQYMLPPFHTQRASVYNYYELMLSILACASEKKVGSIAIYNLWDDARRIPLSYKGNGVLRFLQGRQRAEKALASTYRQGTIYSNY